MKQYVFVFLLLCGGLLAFARASAQEHIGTLSVSDLYLEPSFLYKEGQSGGFSAGNSLVSVKWVRDEILSATITAGTQELVGRPKRYIVQSEDELTLAEAYAEGRTSFGTFRFGRVPLPFGTEAGRGEARLTFRRSLLFQESWMGLRDQGLSYSIENNGFFSDWAIHNGEGGEDLDNQIWFTSRWGYRTSKIYTGFSGSTGHTTPKSTQNPAGSTQRTYAEAGLNPDENARLRFGNAFFEWNSYPFAATVEGTFGDVKQNGISSGMREMHADVQYWFDRDWSVLARYDRLDPNDRMGDDQVEESTLGVSLRGLYQTSSLYLFASRVREQGNGDSNHQILLVWRVTPIAQGPR